MAWGQKARPDPIIRWDTSHPTTTSCSRRRQLTDLEHLLSECPKRLDHDKELGGNIDVANTKRNSDKSPARIAQYIAGYIIKGFKEGALHSNRWTKYGAFDVPPPQHLGQVPNLLAAVDVAYGLLSDFHDIAMDRLDKWKDWFVIHAETRRKGRSGTQKTGG